MEKNLIKSNLTGDFITNIKQSNLLSEALFIKVKNILPELKHDFDTQTIWRTETEIRCSVLNDKDFPDKASKYHQAKLEQSVFFDQLLQLSFDYRKKQQELDIKDAEIEELQDLTDDKDIKKYKIKKIQAKINIKNIEKQELMYGLNNMQKQGEERVRELMIWSKVKSELDDGSFDIDKKDSNQLISMTKKYIQEAYNASRIQSQDISGYNNIMAQFHSLCKECFKRKILLSILNCFNKEVAEWALKTLGLKVEKR